METIEVKILNFVFRFKRLYWRDEFGIKFEPKQDPYRVLMAHALLDVSGVPVESWEEANRVLDALPYPIMSRLYKVWRGSFPASRRFITAGLYKAPDPVLHEISMAREEAQREDAADPEFRRMEAEMESKFGSKQLEEAREISRKILEASKLRGAVRATDDEQLG